jgi:hypothetical protein
MFGTFDAGHRRGDKQEHKYAADDFKYQHQNIPLAALP